MGRNSAATRRNLGGTNLGLRRSCSIGETSLWEGEIIAIVITIDPLIKGGSISINIFTSTISSQTLVHLLYPIFVSKPQIALQKKDTSVTFWAERIFFLSYI